MRQNLLNIYLSVNMIYRSILHLLHLKKFLNMLKDKYKINIYLQGKYPHDPGGRDICQIKEYLEKLYEQIYIVHFKLLSH